MYLAVYVARNALSAASPQMIEAGVFTTEQIGTLSSSYFIVYAVGQLINGAVGLADFDLVCPRDPGRFRGFPYQKFRKKNSSR